MDELLPGMLHLSRAGGDTLIRQLTDQLRGLITGLMTALGGIGHTLPYLLQDFRLATAIAVAVVVAVGLR